MKVKILIVVIVFLTSFNVRSQITNSFSVDVERSSDERWNIIVLKNSRNITFDTLMFADGNIEMLSTYHSNKDSVSLIYRSGYPGDYQRIQADLYIYDNVSESYKFRVVVLHGFIIQTEPEQKRMREKGGILIGKGYIKNVYLIDHNNISYEVDTAYPTGKFEERQSSLIYDVENNIYTGKKLIIKKE